MLEVSPLARRSRDRNSYPPDYRVAFAFSSVPLPAIPTTHLAACLPPMRRNVGFTMFRLNHEDDLAPASTPAVVLSVRLLTENKSPDCTPFWLEPVSVLGSLTIDDACGSSPGLGLSSSLALRPP